MHDHRTDPVDSLLLVGHGSRDPLGNREFLRLAQSLTARQELPLQPCFLEFALPDVAGGIDALVEQGARCIAVQPLMLFAAGHVKRDIPQLLAAAKQRHPQVRFRYGTALGVQPLLVQALCEQLRAAEAAAFPGPAAPTAILFVGRGTDDPVALGQFAAIGQLVAAEMGYPLHLCYLGMAQPDVETGLAAIRHTGATRVLVIPYLFFPGRLLTRLHTLVAAADSERCRMVLAGQEGLGNHPQLIELVTQRYNHLSADPVFWASPLEVTTSRANPCRPG